MIGIGYHQRFFIKKHSFCFLKRNIMFLLIYYVFVIIPLKSYLIHNYIIIIL